MRETGQFPVVQSLLRLAGAVGMLGTGVVSAASWSAWYCGSTALACTITFVLVSREFGPPKVVLRGLIANARLGAAFALSSTAQNAYNDIDKTMVGSLATLDAAGVYTAAYRIIDVAFTPVRAVLYSAYSTFF